MGWAHDVDAMWRFQLDYQSARENYFTVGFTCNLTDVFQFNPALHIANDSSHDAVDYIVSPIAFGYGSELRQDHCLRASWR